MKTYQHIAAITLFTCFSFAVVGQTPVTESELQKLVAEKDRIIIVQDTADVYWVVKASSASIVKTTIEVPRLTDTMIIENKIIVIGGADRTPTKQDLLETVRDNWTEPLESKKTYWDLTGHKPAEMIQIAKGQYAQPKKIEVKSVVTWWCPKAGPTCHDPKD
ncbi:MAG TPA: hypothetical protein VJT50_17100 [Pyrinomonadaceae bacterium]|nr:hypothetical protein [Pyrinomonadaceae bacterium]